MLKLNAASPLIALLLYAACESPSAPVPLSPSTAQAVRARTAGASQLVPFKSSNYTFRTLASAPVAGCDGAGEQQSQLVGWGNATQLGLFSVSFSFCGRSAGRLTDGQGTFVASNGDLLYFVFSGTSSFVPPQFVPFASSVTFTGGTGRFAGATGNATVTGTVDIAMPENTGTWIGQITPPGSSH